MANKNESRKGYAKFRKCIYKCTGIDKQTGKNIIKLSEKTETVVAHPESAVKKWNDAATMQAKPDKKSNQLFIWVKEEEPKKEQNSAPDKK